MRRRQKLSQTPEKFAVNTVVGNVLPFPTRAKESAGVPQHDIDPHPVSYEHASDLALQQLYVLAFGEKPHHRCKRETIIKRLENGAI